MRRLNPARVESGLQVLLNGSLSSSMFWGVGDWLHNRLVVRLQAPLHERLGPSRLERLLEAQTSVRLGEIRDRAVRRKTRVRSKT